MSHLTLGFNANRTGYYYYSRFFSHSEVKQEAVNNTNVELSYFQLDELSESQLSTYLESRRANIHRAARLGVFNVVKYLWKHVELNNSLVRTALEFAASNGHLNIVEFIIQECPNIIAQLNELEQDGIVELADRKSVV